MNDIIRRLRLEGWDDPDPTTSVDEAIKMVQQVLPGWFWRVASCSVSDDAWVSPDANHPMMGEYLQEKYPVINGVDWTEILSSGDGTNWTVRHTEAGNLYNDVQYLNGQFIASRSGTGTIAVSPDGVTWTTRVTGVGAFSKIAYANGVYVAISLSGSNFYRSTDLITWTTTAVGFAARAIHGNSLGFIVVGVNGSARISANGTTWTAVPTGITGELTDVTSDVADDAKYYVIGPQSYHLYGIRSFPTQFRTPNDKPDYGWIRAR